MPSQPQRVTVVWPSSFGAVLDLAGQLPWAARFAIASTLGIVILLALIWALTGFGFLGLDATATVGAVLGIVFAIALGVVLMTLTFYSNRIGQDYLVAGIVRLDVPDQVASDAKQRQSNGDDDRSFRIQQDSQPGQNARAHDSTGSNPGHPPPGPDLNRHGAPVLGSAGDE